MFAAIAVVAIVVSLSFTGARVAYKVSYSGHIIATVSNKNQFNEAVQLVADMVDNTQVETFVEEPTFNTIVVLGGNVNNTAEVADAIIVNTDEIVEAATLFVDGNVVAIAEKAMLNKVINEKLNGFNLDGQECTSHFEQNVTTKDGYFMVEDLDNEVAVENIVNELSVITEVCQVSDVIVPYTTTVEKTNEQVIGYEQVSVAGVSGVTRVTQNIVMLNGEEVSREDVDSQVVVSTVNEVVVVGTAKTLVSAQNKQAAHNAGFAFPLPSGTWQVSAYYGDGRNHKAIDLRAKSGTSIYAALSGTVVYSGWNGAYGNCVIIEHEGGIQTLYGHAKQLCCNVGDTVAQGEIIALVGTTGQSTGNHLHFEVILNGKNVDPAPYIGLD